MGKVARDLGESDGGDDSTIYTPTLFMLTLHCDNLGAVNLMQDSKFHSKAKHIDIRHMFIRNDMAQKNRLKVMHIAGKDQIADVLAKQLPIDAFRRHCKAIGLDIPG
jgi:hypothetical protein